MSLINIFARILPSHGIFYFIKWASSKSNNLHLRTVVEFYVISCTWKFDEEYSNADLQQLVSTKTDSTPVDYDFYKYNVRMDVCTDGWMGGWKIDELIGGWNECKTATSNPPPERELKIIINVFLSPRRSSSLPDEENSNLFRVLLIVLGEIFFLQTFKIFRSFIGRCQNFTSLFSCTSCAAEEHLRRAAFRDVSSCWTEIPERIPKDAYRKNSDSP